MGACPTLRRLLCSADSIDKASRTRLRALDDEDDNESSFAIKQARFAVRLSLWRLAIISSAAERKNAIAAEERRGAKVSR